VLDLWESDPWVRGLEKADQENLIRRLEAIGAYFRREASPGDLRLITRHTGGVLPPAEKTYYVVSTCWRASHLPREDDPNRAWHEIFGIVRSAVSAVCPTSEFCPVSAHSSDPNYREMKEREFWFEDWKWHMTYHALKSIRGGW
jgi:hypothetical protein